MSTAFNSKYYMLAFDTYTRKLFSEEGRNPDEHHLTSSQDTIHTFCSHSDDDIHIEPATYMNWADILEQEEESRSQVHPLPPWSFEMPTPENSDTDSVFDNGKGDKNTKMSAAEKRRQRKLQQDQKKKEQQEARKAANKKRQDQRQDRRRGQQQQQQQPQQETVQETVPSERQARLEARARQEQEEDLRI